MKKIKKIKRKLRKAKKRILKEKEEALFASLAVISFIFIGMCFSMVKADLQEVPHASGPDPKQTMERKIRKEVSNHPIQKMTPYIAKKDKKVAAYLVAIAKKESNWGKYSPKKMGKECYNYWGYKGKINRNAAGYSCFETPAQAVNVVGNRIEKLVENKVDTPAKMVLWKCGNSCSARSSADAAKWVQDVNLYYRKIL